MSARTFSPTDEQRAIAAFVKSGTGNLAIDAGAGTGKSSTLHYVVREIIPRSQSVTMCVFNKRNQVELDAKLKEQGIQKASAKTFAGMAFALFIKKYPHVLSGAAKPDDNKYSKLARWWVHKNLPTDRKPEQLSAAAIFLDKIFKYFLVNTTRDHKTGALRLFIGGSLRDTDSSLVPHDIQEAHALVERYQMNLRYDEGLQHVTADYNAIIEKGIPDLLRIGRQAFHEPDKVAGILLDDKGRALFDGIGKGWVDFIDMMYYAIVEGWQPEWKKYWVLVDEAQDLSPLERALVDTYLLRPSGRLVIVGDPAQAINMFKGADNSSFSNSQIFWNIQKTLPLSVCWRCCVEVVELAAGWKKGFTAAPNATSGEIADINDEDVLKLIEDGDAIISRTRAPLVTWWRKLTKAGRPAKISGSNPGETVVRMLERISQTEDFSFKRLFDSLNKYERTQTDVMLQKRRPETEILSFKDDMETVRIMCKDTEAKTLEDLIRQIEYELDPKRMPKGGITVQTAHASKGGEWPRVFCVTPELFPLVTQDQTQEQLEQEHNLEYVMWTRAMRGLYFVSKEHQRYDPNNPQKNAVTVSRDEDTTDKIYHGLPDENEDEEFYDEDEDEVDFAVTSNERFNDFAPASVLAYLGIGHHDDDGKGHNREIDAFERGEAEGEPNSPMVAAHVGVNMTPSPKQTRAPYKGLPPLEGDLRDEEEPTKSPDLLAMDPLPDGEPEPVLLIFSPKGEKQKTPLLEMDDDPEPISQEQSYALGAAVIHADKNARVGQIAPDGKRLVEYIEPNNPPYRWADTPDLMTRERAPLPTNPVLIKVNSLARIDSTKVLLTEAGKIDKGAEARAVSVARALAGMDLWDGFNTPIRVDDPYAVHDRLEEKRYVTLAMENGELTVRLADAPAPAEPTPADLLDARIAAIHANPTAPFPISIEVPAAPAPIPANPFRATGDLKKDMQAAKVDQQSRLFQSISKLGLKESLTLIELLQTHVEELEAEAAPEAATV